MLNPKQILNLNDQKSKHPKAANMRFGVLEIRILKKKQIFSRQMAL